MQLFSVKFKHSDLIFDFPDGSLDRSMISLFETLSDGIHWGELNEPLAEHCSPWFPVIFVLYSAFQVLPPFVFSADRFHGYWNA